MPNRTALCLTLLVLAAAPAMARDVRQMGANGDGGCPEQATDPVLPPQTRAAASRDATVREARPAATRGGDQGVRPPRWHSFLPGMFR